MTCQPVASITKSSAPVAAKIVTGCMKFTIQIQHGATHKKAFAQTCPKTNPLGGSES
jgi:hypothetical protein